MNKKISLFTLYVIVTFLGSTALGTEHYISQTKPEDEFRDFEVNTPEQVKQFYYQKHVNQTVEYVLSQKTKYAPLDKAYMSIWDAFKVLDSLIDESDPDTALPQIYHAFQTAEALKKDGHPEWLILTGFIHDLGKILTTFGEPQWAVVGDIYPVGCSFSEKIVLSRFLEHNPDYHNPVYQTKYGIYQPQCGLRNVHMAWGHDEYLYYVVKDYLPEEALYIIRFHSFFALHKDGAYDYLMDDYDQKMLAWLKLFSRYDLYSKADGVVIDVAAVMPYYQELVAEFFPEKLCW